MAVINMGSHILISHLGEPVQELGEMSTELAIWLERKYFEQVMREQKREKSDPKGMINLVDPNDPEQEYFRLFGRDPLVHEINNRSEQAAQRGYRPPLANNIGRLTPLGFTKAQQARVVLAELNDERQDFSFEPEKWELADDFIINATLPVRCIKMLGIMAKAIDDAERKLATETREAVQAELNRLRLEREEKERNRTNQQNLSLLGLNDVLQDRATPDQNPNLVLLDVGQSTTKAFVPVALMREKAKTDLKYLIKYGLVNLGAYRDGSAGRPKHVVSVSTPGIKVFNHINRLGYLD